MFRTKEGAWLACILACACGGHTTKDSGTTGDTDSGEDTASTLWAYPAAGWFLSCGIHVDGRAECWGLEGLTRLEDTGCCGYFDSGVNLPPPDSFRSLSLVLSAGGGSDVAAGAHACGLRGDGTVACWGRNDEGQIEAPSGEFASVDVFDVGSCGLRPSGEIECWGEYFEPPPGLYHELSAGFDAAAALDIDGNAHAWWSAAVTGGEMPEVRVGPFTTISVGSFACALGVDGTLLCWDPGFPDSDERYAGFTPSGPFIAVSVGGNAACALQPDGHPVCFGPDPDRPEYDVPDVSLVQISCGTYNVCGVTADHAIVCWGDNTYGQSTPPT